jgi:hypothetical protein
MAAAKSADELKQLQDRVAELEKQLRDLKTLVEAGQVLRRHSPDVSLSAEEAEEHDKAHQWVREYIRKEREKDLKRVNAEIDRLEAKEKRATAQRRKPAKTTPKGRRAG